MGCGGSKNDPIGYSQQPIQYAQPAPQYAQPGQYQPQPMMYAPPPQPMYYQQSPRQDNGTRNAVLGAGAGLLGGMVLMDAMDGGLFDCGDCD